MLKLTSSRAIFRHLSVTQVTIITTVGLYHTPSWFIKVHSKMMQDVLEANDSLSQPGLIQRFSTSICRLYQHYLDKWTPHTASRWVFTLVMIVGFMLRIMLRQGWYIVCYALGIYHLNLFLAFLTPKIDPAFSQDDDDGPSLPTKVNEEFRPFMRRLPEFKFWYSVTKSTLVAFFCTFFQHMIKYKYLPFSLGKPRYQAHQENVKPAAH
ncbi:RER1-like [Homarus americanus]|uniref:RER1-like n=1 Tax=Homarus americanus TaxID=6706 RepID=A0A8J5KC38_HOMAM|nr:RER1-like [Homarus americanus]